MKVKIYAVETDHSTKEYVSLSQAVCDVFTCGHYIWQASGGQAGNLFSNWKASLSRPLATDVSKDNIES